jgi:hypothetical protein
MQLILQQLGTPIRNTDTRWPARPSPSGGQPGQKIWAASGACCRHGERIARIGVGLGYFQPKCVAFVRPWRNAELRASYGFEEGELGRRYGMDSLTRPTTAGRGSYVLSEFY